MIKKAEAVNWSLIIAMYAVTTTMFPLIDYTSALRETKIPAYMQQADQILFGYIGIFALFFVIMFIYKIYLKIYYLKLANRYPRQNMTIITNTGMYFEEGVGLVQPKPVQVSQVKAEEYINDEDLKRMYKERTEWLTKFNKVNIDDMDDTTTETGIEFEIPTVKGQDFNFAAYKIDSLKTKNLLSFFGQKEMDFFTSKGITTVDQYLAIDDDKLKAFEKEYLTINKEQLFNMDFKKVQIQLLNTIDYFSKEEIDFFHTQGIHTMQEMMNADLKKLSAEFNENFKMKSVNEKIKNAYKKKTGKEYQEDNIVLEAVVEDLRSTIVEKERKFVYNLSKDARYKYVYLKLVILKAIHYDYHAYIMQFDKNIVINVGRSYKAGESFEKFVKGEDEYEDFTDIVVNKALVILPTALENAYKYSLGMLNDFHGVPTECEQLTEAEYIFRGMLDSDHAVLLCNNCSYLRDALKLKSLVDPLTIQKIERDAMRDILNESITQREGFQKLMQLQQSRLQKKDDEMEMIFARLIDDLNALETARKFVMERKPINSFMAIVIVLFFILGFFIGIAIFGGWQSIVAAQG